MTLYLADDCPYCIDGNMPAGTHQILGPVYRPCPVCLIVCGFCDGEGLFPADYTCLECFRADLAAAGLHPIMCRRCLGVVDLIPIDTFAVRPEVPRHDHP